jgi:hypothetical protein
MELRPFERWCQNRRSLGFRPLTSAEWARLNAKRRGVGWRVAGPIAGYLACSFVLLQLRPLLPQAELGAFTLDASPFLGMLLGLPIALMLAADRLREALDISRDLRASRVERFAAVDPTTFTAGPALIEVCHPSGRLLTGPAFQVGRVAAIREIAPAPFAVLREEHHVEGVPASAHLERRPLSEEECEELRRSARGLEKVRASSVLLLLWLDVCAIGWVQPGKTFSSGDMMAAVGLAAVAAYVIWRALRDRSLARRLLADVAAGFALVVASPGRLEADEEALPHSRLHWNVAGQPADWRGLAVKGRARG